MLELIQMMFKTSLCDDTEVTIENFMKVLLHSES